MKATGVCPKCGYKEILADARAVDKGDGFSRYEQEVSTFQHPDALIFKNERTTTLSAYVCLRCGYIEYYADNPQALIEEW